MPTHLPGAGQNRPSSYPKRPGPTRPSRPAARRWLGTMCCVAVLTAIVCGRAEAQPCDLTGTWTMNVPTATGSVILVDDGSGVLTGHGDLGGIVFTVSNGSYVAPAVGFDLSGAPFPARYAGTSSDCDTSSGQLLNNGSPFFSATLQRQRDTYCGDGLRQLADGEQCDDGNFLDGDNCSSKCLLTSCGNGIVDPYEECDLGAANAADGACRPGSCTWAACGDGVRIVGTIPPGAPVAPEECDAGTGNSNDPNAACRLDCTMASCGDGIRDDSAGERCDEGAAMPTATCAACKVPNLAHGIEYTLTDLSAVFRFKGFVNYVNVNELGQIAGYFDNEGPNNAFFWDGSRTVIIPPTNPDGESYAFGLNESGQVAGGMSVLPSHEEHAFLWSGGVVTDLQPALGLSGHAYDVNRSGQAVGIVNYGGGSYRGFLWDGVTTHDLGTYPGGTHTEAFAINDRGDVALTGNTPPLLQQHSLLLRNGSWIDVGTLGSDASNTWGLSNAGHVAGDSSRPDGSGRGFLYDGGPLIDLGVLGGNRSSARAVNASGQVVGFSSVSGGGDDHAFLYDCRGMSDLNDLIAPGSGLLLDISDWRISDAGQIAGVAFDTTTGEDRAVLLTPVPFCGNCRVTPASGEQCDDGNTVDGDGCSASCKLEATPPVTGEGSVSTGATATPSQPVQAAVTSPSGGTVTITRTTGTTAPNGLEVLGVRFVIDAPPATVEAPLVLDFTLDPSLLPAGLAADDVQILRDGVVAGPCAGTAPHTTASPDPCVASRTIVAGGDVVIRTLSSHASEWAFASEICPQTPDPACAAPTKPGKSVLLVKGGSPDQSALSWTWTSGPATSTADFGNPRGTGRVTACLYDSTSGSAKLSKALEIPAGGQCGKKPCWKATKKGFDYTDGSGSADGIGKLTLIAGAAGKSKVVLRGKGTMLPLPTLPLQAPVAMQLRTAAGKCFGATFSTAAPVKDPAAQFKGKSD